MTTQMAMRRQVRPQTLVESKQRFDRIWDENKFVANVGTFVAVIAVSWIVYEQQKDDGLVFCPNHGGSSSLAAAAAMDFNTGKTVPCHACPANAICVKEDNGKLPKTFTCEDEAQIPDIKQKKCLDNRKVEIDAEAIRIEAIEFLAARKMQSNCNAWRKSSSFCVFCSNDDDNNNNNNNINHNNSGSKAIPGGMKTSELREKLIKDLTPDKEKIVSIDRAVSLIANKSENEINYHRDQGIVQHKTDEISYLCYISTPLFVFLLMALIAVTLRLYLTAREQSNIKNIAGQVLDALKERNGVAFASESLRDSFLVDLPLKQRNKKWQQVFAHIVSLHDINIVIDRDATINDIKTISLMYSSSAISKSRHINSRSRNASNDNFTPVNPQQRKKQE